MDIVKWGSEKEYNIKEGLSLGLDTYTELNSESKLQLPLDLLSMSNLYTDLKKMNNNPDIDTYIRTQVKMPDYGYCYSYCGVYSPDSYKEYYNSTDAFYGSDNSIEIVIE